ARGLAPSWVVRGAAPYYLARRGAPATASEVSQHDCLNFAFEQLRHSWPVEWDNQQINVPIVSRMVSNSGAVLRQAALAGMGIMVRPSFTLEGDFESGRLVQLLPGHHLGDLSVRLVYPSRRLLSAKVRSFVDFMNAQFPHPERDPWLPDA
ncbi:MAG: substrate binding domain-containing protein, partial [Telluria sp.]